jgi:hypothetical protein
MRRLVALSVLGVAVGCASVLGLPNDTASFCARQENHGHSYCEDFDIGDPSTRWTYAFALGDASWSLQPSDASPPNLIALSSPGVPAEAGSALTGFDKEFTDASFGGVHVEADMRLVPSQGNDLGGATGFLLITDKAGGCVALNFSPQGTGAFALQTAEICALLTTTHASVLDGGGADGGAFVGAILGPLPPRNSWFHIIVDVKPDSNGTGSGTLTINVVGEPTGYISLAIQAGTLTPTGTPLVGFSNAAQPGSSPLDVEYDNVTIDLSP